MNNEQLWQWFLTNRQNMDNAGLNSLADAYQWGRHGNPAAMRVRLAGQLQQLAQQDPTGQALWNPPGQPAPAAVAAVPPPAPAAAGAPAAGGPAVVTQVPAGGAAAAAPPATKVRTDYDPDPAIARSQIHAEHSLGTITADNARDLLVVLDGEVAAAAAGTPPAPAPAAAPAPAPPAATTATAAAAGGIGGWFTGVWGAIRGRPPVATPAPGAAAAAPPAPAAAGAPAGGPMRNDPSFWKGVTATMMATVILLLYLIVARDKDWFPFHDNGNAVPASSQSSNNPGNSGGGNPTNGGGGTTPPKVIAGETDSDKNGIADETRRDLGMIPGDGVCPTDDQVQAALGGLTVHWISGCLFKWNSNGVDFVTRTCPAGYYCTLDMGGENVAWKGGGEKYRFEGGSFWPLADKTFADQCVYLRHENVYAGIVGDPPTLAGNFSCDGAKPATSGATTTSASTGGSSATQTTNGCLVNSSADAARLIGGDAGNWAQLEPGVFKYRNKGTYTAGFKHPGGTGRLDYWGNNKPESLTSSGEVPYPQDEMTFHCKS